MEDGIFLLDASKMDVFSLKALTVALGSSVGYASRRFPVYNTGNAFDDRRFEKARLERLEAFASRFNEMREKHGEIGFVVEGTYPDLVQPRLDTSVYINQEQYDAHRQDLCGLPTSIYIDNGRGYVDEVTFEYPTLSATKGLYNETALVGVNTWGGVNCKTNTSELIPDRILSSTSEIHHRGKFTYVFNSLDLGERMHRDLSREGSRVDVKCRLSGVNKLGHPVCTVYHFELTTRAGDLIYRKNDMIDGESGTWAWPDPFPLEAGLPVTSDRSPIDPVTEAHTFNNPLRSKKEDKPDTPDPQAAPEEKPKEAPGEVTRSAAKSANSEPVKITVYSSFTCSHCADFHNGPRDRILSDYVSDGKVEISYSDIYYDRIALWASMMARCSNEEVFSEISDVLFETQGEWDNGEPSEVVSNLRRIGTSAGLSANQIDACLNNSDEAQALVRQAQERAETLKITGIPTFIIDGDKYNNLSYENLSGIIDGKLSE